MGSAVNFHILLHNRCHNLESKTERDFSGIGHFWYCLRHSLRNIPGQFKKVLATNILM